MTIDLDWPPRQLSPNNTVGSIGARMKKAEAAKVYRNYAYWTTRAAEIPPITTEGEIILRIDFHPPDRRRRDLDNMFASAKNALDGIADALQVNDQRFGFEIHRGDPIKGGLVRVRIGDGQ